MLGKKQDFERFLISLNIKMSAKSKKIELNEEFRAMWREKEGLWDIMPPFYRDKNEKGESLKRICQINFRFFQTDNFE